MALELRSSEIEHQFIQERISMVELQMSTLCNQFSSYNRKVACQRDSGDQLSKTLLKLAAKEVLNPTVRTSIAKLSDIIRAIQDYREAEVQRIEHLVILEFKAYDQICKQAREQLKKSFAARARELTKRERLEKQLGKKPTNWQNINQAEKEADRARTEASHATLHLSQEIDSFEKRKIEDIKRVLTEFIKIEMIFHGKALELFTKAHETISAIQPTSDLQEFRNHFKTAMSTVGPPEKHSSFVPMSGDSSKTALPFQKHETILGEGHPTIGQISQSSSSSDVSDMSSLSDSANDGKKMFKSFKDMFKTHVRRQR